MGALKKLGYGALALGAGATVTAGIIDPQDRLVDESTLVRVMDAEAGRYDVGNVTIDANPGDDSTCVVDYTLTTRDGNSVTITVPRVGEPTLRDATVAKDVVCLEDAKYNLEQGIDAVRRVGYGSCDDVAEGKQCGGLVSEGLAGTVGFFKGMGRGFGRMYDTVLGVGGSAADKATDLTERLKDGYNTTTR
ncbi:MAG: hypothetical protein ABIH82_03725 [Candidatus Woesearchaeota archaeon]